MTEFKLFNKPLKLVHNRVYRGYPGGREIDKFRDSEECSDDYRPEAWVGSVTRAAYFKPGEYDPNLGLAEVHISEDEKAYVRNVIASDPAAFLGEKHASRYGEDIAILTKLLDSKRQLGLQTHPDRDFARKYFDSDYGKTESWYILGTRDDQDEEPYVLLGFKEGITKERFKELFLDGNVPEMEKCCHKIPVKAGDIFFVDAGVPHAIGPGCFMIEVQEASDVGVGAKIKHFEDPLEEKLFIEKTIGCYHYTGRNYEENLRRFLVEPGVLVDITEGREMLLLGSKQTPYFSITRIDAAGDYVKTPGETFSIAIVIDGKGKLACGSYCMDVKKGDELFLPAGIKELIWKPQDGCLSVVEAHPPGIY